MTEQSKHSIYCLMMDDSENRKYSDLSQVLDIIGTLENTKNQIKLYRYLVDIYNFPMKQLIIFNEYRYINPAGIVDPTPYEQTAYVYTPRINEIQTWKNGKLNHLWWAGRSYDNRLQLEAFIGANPPPDVVQTVTNPVEIVLAQLFQIENKSPSFVPNFVLS
jgi:hypothetical protein